VSEIALGAAESKKWLDINIPGPVTEWEHGQRSVKN
jgi:hypothetical protein